MSTNLSADLARFSARLTFDDIPANVIEKAKQLIIDTAAIMISSTRMEFGEKAIRTIASSGGASQATAFGLSGKIPVQNAALCNGILAHGQDYDDTHTEAVVHATAALFPAAFAVGEHMRASGRDILTALVAGTEAAIRIALPFPNKFHQHGFHTTSLTTSFASALIAAKLKNLTVEQTVNALGIVGSFVSGLVECVPAGADAKRLHTGWSAMCGITAAQFAEIGYSGPLTVFEGKFGLYSSMLRGETLELANLFSPIGNDWEILNIRPKLYPCCHFLQGYIDCAEFIRREHKIDPEQITEINCRVAQGAVSMVCEPWQEKLRPTTAYGARFSLPFAVALTLAKHKAGPQEFTGCYLGDSSIAHLMAKTNYAVDPKYQVKDMPAWVEIATTGGRRYTHEIPKVGGDYRNPFTPDQIRKKFEANATFLSDTGKERLLSLLSDFENLTSPAELTKQLTSDSVGLVRHANVDA